jgi:hypothetical protein
VKAQSHIYELRIALQGIHPPIWRLIQVPSTYALCYLHDVVQTAMGWTNSHLHQFEKGGQRWGVPEHDGEADVNLLDERRTKISALLKVQGDSVSYVYDFGDYWRHEVVLEKIFPLKDTAVRPLCVSGERHCPPEDVGGPPGYEQFLEAIFERRHKEYEHSVRWVGGSSALTQSAERFRPEEFDAKVVNAILARRRWPARNPR